MSLRHGDPTARDAGRLSLNPLRHVDLVRDGPAAAAAVERRRARVRLREARAGQPGALRRPAPRATGHGPGRAGRQPGAGPPRRRRGVGGVAAGRSRRRRDELAVARRRRVHPGEPGADVLQPDPDPAPRRLERAAALPLEPRPLHLLPAAALRVPGAHRAAVGHCRPSSRSTRSAPTSGTPSTRSSTCSCRGSGREDATRR
ncbi:MAG: hypothetical protein MZW92_12255 [Comamonadaceae bacterium]|nr:hypothetical protein [Comamonadaceae bacterium]